MTLVERLRDWASPHYAMQLPEIPLAQKDMREAADRLEALEPLEAEIVSWRKFADEMKAEEARLRAEVAALQESARLLREEMAGIAADADAEVAALRKGAERYRIWRDEFTSPSGPDKMSELLSVLADAWTPEAVDAAIDAAIQQHAGG